MNTTETQKNAFDMLSEKQQNPKCYVHHCKRVVQLKERRLGMGRTRLWC